MLHFCILGPQSNKYTAALHAVTSVIYKRAIVHAISDLQDSYLRSNVDSIRRKVQASLDKEDGGGNHHQLHTPWNETIFLKTLKSLVQNGDVEQCTSLNCGLSPEFKRKVNSKAQALCLQHQQQEQLQQQQQLQQYYASQNVTELNSPHITGHHRRTFEDKETPAKKAEHFKLKIVPKRIYDNQQ